MHLDYCNSSISAFNSKPLLISTYWSRCLRLVSCDVTNWPKPNPCLLTTFRIKSKLLSKTYNILHNFNLPLVFQFLLRLLAAISHLHPSYLPFIMNYLSLFYDYMPWVFANSFPPSTWDFSCYPVSHLSGLLISNL